MFSTRLRKSSEDNDLARGVGSRRERRAPAGAGARGFTIANGGPPSDQRDIEHA